MLANKKCVTSIILRKRKSQEELATLGYQVHSEIKHWHSYLRREKRVEADIYSVTSIIFRKKKSVD